MAYYVGGQRHQLADFWRGQLSSERFQSTCALSIVLLLQVDILDGANVMGPNEMALRTTRDCAMLSTRNMTRMTLEKNCYLNDDETIGCSVASNKPDSYGSSFNGAGGGWYVLERTPSFINIYFWSRSELRVPATVKSGSSIISSSGLGLPVASFQFTSSCSSSNHFDGNKIFFGLTFCDNRGEATYQKSGCGLGCDDFVDSRPPAFVSAYWTVNAVRVYTKT